jgi:dihydropyrimidinase
MAEHYDTIISGGLLVEASGITDGSLGIRGETIAAVGDLGDATADHTVDATGKYVFPGFIDAHSHPVYGDNLEQYSQVMAYSGVTTVIPFIGAVPAWGEGDGDSFTVIDGFISEGERLSTLDFAVHTTFPTGVDPESEVRGMRDRGIVSGKMFMCFPERGLYQDDRTIAQLMSELAKNGCVAMVHAENDAIVDFEQARLVAEGRTAPTDYPSSRPPIAEAEAVFRACSIAEATGCPVYLVHLSARESLDVVRWFRKRGRIPIYAETCTHYLTLTEDDFVELEGLIKISPPVRTRADVDAMWEAVADGTIDVVATDGSGQKRARKENTTGNIFDVPFGIPGSQSMVPLVYSEGVNSGRITLPEIARIWGERPAKIFGLYPRKGTLAVGSDADITIMDPAETAVLPGEERGGTSDYNPYEGRTVIGLPSFTMQRGRVLLDDGELRAVPGSGQFLRVGPGARP